MNMHAAMTGDIKAVCAQAAAESEATETARQLSPELARALARAGYFNMFVPNALGGQQLSPPDAMARFQFFKAVLHFTQKSQLMGKFLIDIGVGLIAAGRHIEIMHGNRLGLWPALHRHRNMATVALAAIIDYFTGDDCVFGQGGNPVIPLNAVLGNMAETRFGKGFFGELIIRAFGLLQANNIRVELFNQLEHQFLAQTHRINVP